MSLGGGPQSPSLRSYVELLLDSPEFLPCFGTPCHHSPDPCRTAFLVGAGRLGIRTVSVPFSENSFYPLSHPDADALPGHHAVQLFGAGQHSSHQHTVVCHPARCFFHLSVFLMYRFFRSIPEAILESAKLDTGSAFQIFLNIGLPLGSAGIVSALVLRFLENWNLIEQPLAF